MSYYGIKAWMQRRKKDNIATLQMWRSETEREQITEPRNRPAFECNANVPSTTGTVTILHQAAQGSAQVHEFDLHIK